MPGTPRDDAVPGTKLLCRKPRRSNRVEEGCWPRCRFGGCTPARTSRSARVMNCRRTRLLLPRGNPGGPVEHDGDWSRAGAGGLERFQEEKFLTVGSGTVLVGRGTDRDPGLKQNFG